MAALLIRQRGDVVMIGGKVFSCTNIYISRKDGSFRTDYSGLMIDSIKVVLLYE